MGASPTCHPERPHYAKSKCKRCYEFIRIATDFEKSEKAAADNRRYQAAYRARKADAESRKRWEELRQDEPEFVAALERARGRRVHS